MEDGPVGTVEGSGSVDRRQPPCDWELAAGPLREPEGSSTMGRRRFSFGVSSVLPLEVVVEGWPEPEATTTGGSDEWLDTVEPASEPVVYKRR